MIPLLQRVARTARLASLGKRVVAVSLTEEGFAISATSASRSGQPLRASGEISFAEVDHRPDLLVNAVVLVTREIEKAERQAS